VALKCILMYVEIPPEICVCDFSNTPDSHYSYPIKYKLHTENSNVLIWVDNVLKNITTFLNWKCLYFDTLIPKCTYTLFKN